MGGAVHTVMDTLAGAQEDAGLREGEAVGAIERCKGAHGFILTESSARRSSGDVVDYRDSIIMHVTGLAIKKANISRKT